MKTLFYVFFAGLMMLSGNQALTARERIASAPTDTKNENIDKKVKDVEAESEDKTDPIPQGVKRLAWFR